MKRESDVEGIVQCMQGMGMEEKRQMAMQMAV